VRPLGKDDPRQIGPFRITGLLGGGGMGRVHLGRAVDGRTVAVKTARAELALMSGEYTRILKKWHLQGGAVTRAVANGGRWRRPLGQPPPRGAGQRWPTRCAASVKSGAKGRRKSWPGSTTP
jgi:hypothetical protein